MAWDLDFTGKTVDEVDKSGGEPPNGYYRAKLAEVKSNPEDGSEEFVFKISRGPHSNRIVRGKLWNPRFAEDEEKKNSAMRKASIWAVRLGLVKKGDEGKLASVEFSSAVGWEGVIKKSSYVSKSNGREYHEVDYAGVYPLDHHDLDGPTRASLDLPLLPGQSATDPKAGKQSKSHSEKTVPGAASGSPATPPAASADDIAKSLFS